MSPKASLSFSLALSCTFRRHMCTEMLSTLSATLMKAFSGRDMGARRKAKKAPPPPLPLAPRPPPRQVRLNIRVPLPKQLLLY